jgi:hypothetical protein
MLTLNLPAFFARLKPKISPSESVELNQEEIRELQRIRSELALEREKQRLQLMWHSRFTL